MPSPQSPRGLAAGLIACVPWAAGCGGLAEFLCAGGGPNAGCPVERRDRVAAADRPEPGERSGGWAAYVARVPAGFFGRRDEAEGAGGAHAETTPEATIAVASYQTSDSDVTNPDPLAEAEAALAAGRLDEATGLFRSALSSGEKAAPRAAHRLAVLADLRGDYAAADRHYARALAARPDDADLLNDAGYSQILRGRSADALPLLTAALEHDPAHRRAAANLELVGHEKTAEAVRTAALGSPAVPEPAPRPREAVFDRDGYQATLGDLARP